MTYLFKNLILYSLVAYLIVGFLMFGAFHIFNKSAKLSQKDKMRIEDYPYIVWTVLLSPLSFPILVVEMIILMFYKNSNKNPLEKE